MWKKSLTFLALCLLSEVCFAGEKAQVNLPGRRAKIELEFSEKVSLLLRKFKDWESRLSQNGVEAEFLLGAGELRRALLQMPVENPGDVEVFLHVKSHWISGKTTSQARLFLSQNGVALDQEVAAIFGPTAKLDFFVKDKDTLASGRPFFGDFGFFSDMGEHSLNRLLYAPTTNSLLGEPEDLERLAQSKVVFLEGKKGRRLDVAKNIPGFEVKSHYPQTILRLAFKAIRLYLDLKLTPNKNKIKLDRSFSTALKGFEKYFKDVPWEDLQRFRLNPVYIEHFAKIFRSRTNDELAKVREILYADFPATVAIWEKIGLDIEAATAPRFPRQDQNRLEVMMVFANAEFDDVRPLMDRRSYQLTSPFASPARMSKWLKTIPLEKSVEQWLIVPEEVIKIYSPDLQRRISVFDSLSLLEQLNTLRRYIEAVKLLSKSARKRIDEVSFRENYFVRFPFVDVNRLSSDDESLLAFIQSEIDRSKTSRIGSKVLRFRLEQNQKYFDEIDRRITQSLSTDLRPSILVDLDGTLFSDASRLYWMLKSYDSLHGTEFFSDLQWWDLPGGKNLEFLSFWLSSKLDTYAEVASVIGFVQEEISDGIFDFPAIQNALPEEEVLQKVKEWNQKGAEIVFLTARPEFQRERTQQRLNTLGLNFGKLIMKQGKGGAAKYKLAELEKWEKMDADRQVIAFIDDDRLNCQAVRNARPEILSLRFFSRRDPKTGKGLVLFTENDHDVYRFWRQSFATCAEWFQNF